MPGSQRYNSQKMLSCIVFTLLAAGVIMVYSSSAFSLSDPTYKLRRQVLWAVVATLCMVITWNTDYRIYARYRRLILAGTVVLLLCVYLPGIGREVNGAHRWLRIGSLSVQPSELAKVAMVIYVAASMDRLGDKAKSFTKGFLPLAGIIAFVSLLVLVEPDFGTASFIAALGFALMFIGGVRVAHVMAFGSAALLPLLGMLALRFEHVRQRFSIFLNIDADPLGKCYQIKQSLIALGSGGLFGLGLGASKQKLMFLPEREAGFIYSIIGEELGFVGTAAVIVLFLLFLRQGMKIADSCRDKYSYLLATGITVSITMQAAINIAVVTACVPPKGIALPFLSFGGSSLLATMIAVGILLNIAMQNPEPLAAETRESEGPEDEDA